MPLFINITILSIILLTLCVTFFLSALITDDDDAGEKLAVTALIFFCGLLVWLLVGFWWFANTTEKVIITEIKPIEILKSKSKVYLEFDIGTDNIFYLNFSEKKEYDEIDSTTFYKIERIDYYGNFIKYDVSKSVKFKNLPQNKKLIYKEIK